MVTNLFITTFDMLAGPNQSASGEQITKNVEYNLTELLIIIVDESATLPQEVIDVIIAQFLRMDPSITEKRLNQNRPKKGPPQALEKNQSTLQLRELPPSYNLAKTICNTCGDKMARHISQYFNDIIVDSSNNTDRRNANKRRRLSEDIDSSDMDMTLVTSEEDLKELSRAHNLLRELWRACPTVLQNVVPQLEAELSAENINLRKLATETFGDMISGISSAGMPDPPALDPAGFPYVHLSGQEEPHDAQNPLLKPCSPQSFLQIYPQAYQSYLSRRHDKSPLIRAAWTTGICRILRTSAGGVGLSQAQEDGLKGYIPTMLKDSDDKVRLAAVRAVGSFTFADVVLKLGSLGGIEKHGSIVNVLAERVRDLKHNVRAEAMMVLGRLWGVAVGELAAGNEKVRSVLGAAASVIFATYYTNDPDIHLLIDRAVCESLLPLDFPPSKRKKFKHSRNGGLQAGIEHDSAKDAEQDEDPDQIRAERIMLLAGSLDSKSKSVCFALQSRQVMFAKAMKTFTHACEEFNGGVVEKNEKEVKLRLSKLVDSLSKGFPESLRVKESLWKLAKSNDRRVRVLLRYAIDPESDYTTILRAIKELEKRMEAIPNSSPELRTCLMALLYRASPLVYNRSHVPAIMQHSRNTEGGLSTIANEVLKDMSTRTPDVLASRIQQLCQHLQDNAPSKAASTAHSSLNDLKACASFAKHFPAKIPKDRKFVEALKSFALWESPAETGKHAVTILMVASDKKDFFARDLLQKCTANFGVGKPAYVTQLAALSQLMLLAPEQADNYGDAISEISIQKVLMSNNSATKSSESDYIWSEDLDEGCEAKCWALKILANRIRSHADEDTLFEVAEPVLTTLTKLISQSGELSPFEDEPKTSPTTKPRLRLLAARISLKLCLSQAIEKLYSPSMFNKLSLVLQDEQEQVRSLFLRRLKKYLNASKLSKRFFTLPFMLAYEPNDSLRIDTTTWLRSRTAAFHEMHSPDGNLRPSIIMESIFARLLSLLAHHPDFSTDEEDLIAFTRYILFYLHPVASEDNLSLIYHIAQRVKQTQDAIPHTDDQAENLYYLSDLAQLVIRKFEDAQRWTMQTQPAKATLPRTLFTEIRDHAKAQKIADKSYISEDLEDRIEAAVKSSMRAARHPQNRKRKSEAEDGQGTNGREVKKIKTLPLRNAPASKEKKSAVNGGGRIPKTKKAAAPKSRTPKVEEADVDRRRSGRVRAGQSLYQERNDDEDDEEMMEGVAEWTYTDEKGNNIVGDEDDDIEDEDEDEDKGNQDGDDEDEEDKASSPTVVAGANAQEEADNDDEVSDAAPASPSPPPSSAKGLSARKKAAPPASKKAPRRRGKR